jgi:hypothetical protein
MYKCNHILQKDYQMICPYCNSDVKGRPIKCHECMEVIPLGYRLGIFGLWLYHMFIMALFFIFHMIIFSRKDITPMIYIPIFSIATMLFHKIFRSFFLKY